jgi:branched-chain amino acid transport system substrate-binding protein
MMKQILMASTLALTTIPGMAHADVTVAVAGPMTGQYASFFEQMKQGAQGAVTAINAAGGINGQKIILDLEDDACDPKQAVAAANKITSQSIAGVIGHFCSSSSIPASEVYAEAGIPQISPGSTNPTFTERGLQNVFRTCGRDDQQSGIAAAAIIDKKLGTKVAVIDDKSTYGKGLADGVRAALKAKGMPEVVDDTVTQGDKDFSTLISKLKAANVDMIFYGGYFAEAGLLVRQAHEQGLAAHFMGGDGIAASEFASIAGPASNGVYMTFYPDPRNNPGAAAIVKSFRDAHYEPEGYTLYTYAALTAYAQAATRAGTTDGAKVSAELHKGTYDTVLGKISFDKKGDPNAEPFTVYVWKDGKYTPTK